MLRHTYLTIGVSVVLAAVSLLVAQNAGTARPKQPQQPINPQQRDPITGLNSNLANPNNPNVQNNEIIDRLRNQASPTAGRQMTLTGRITDFQTFFFGPTTPTPALQGQAISPNTNRTPGTAAPGATTVNPSAQNQPTLAPNQSVGAINPQNQQQQQGQVLPGVNAPTNPSAPGSVPPGVANAKQPLVGDTTAIGTAGSLMIFQTSSSTFLAMSDPTAAAGLNTTLQPTGQEQVRVRGRLIERSGLRLLLVSETEPVGRGANRDKNRGNQADDDNISNQNQRRNQSPAQTPRNRTR